MTGATKARYLTFRYYSPSHGCRVIRYSTAGPDGELSVTIPEPTGRGAKAIRDAALDDLVELVEARERDLRTESRAREAAEAA